MPQLITEVTDEMLDAAVVEVEQREVIRALGLRSAMIVPLVVSDKPFGVLSFVAAESGRRYNKQDLIMATEIGRRASLAVENSRLYSEARAAVAIRDTFLSVASHELRTPLTTLSILTTSLVRAARHGRLPGTGGEGLADRLEKADRQARHLARLVDRLLDVTRLSAGDLGLERANVDLGEIAREVVARFEDRPTSASSSADWPRCAATGIARGSTKSSRTSCRTRSSTAARASGSRSRRPRPRRG